LPATDQPERNGEDQKGLVNAPFDRFRPPFDGLTSGLVRKYFFLRITGPTVIYVQNMRERPGDWDSDGDGNEPGLNFELEP